MKFNRIALLSLSDNWTAEAVTVTGLEPLIILLANWQGTIFSVSVLMKTIAAFPSRFHRSGWHVVVVLGLLLSLSACKRTRETTNTTPKAEVPESYLVQKAIENRAPAYLWLRTVGSLRYSDGSTEPVGRPAANHRAQHCAVKG